MNESQTRNYSRSFDGLMTQSRMVTMNEMQKTFKKNYQM